DLEELVKSEETRQVLAPDVLGEVLDPHLHGVRRALEELRALVAHQALDWGPQRFLLGRLLHASRAMARRVNRSRVARLPKRQKPRWLGMSPAKLEITKKPTTRASRVAIEALWILRPARASRY